MGGCASKRSQVHGKFAYTMEDVPQDKQTGKGSGKRTKPYTRNAFSHSSFGYHPRRNPSSTMKALPKDSNEAVRLTFQPERSHPSSLHGGTTSTTLQARSPLVSSRGTSRFGFRSARFTENKNAPLPTARKPAPSDQNLNIAINENIVNGNNEELAEIVDNRHSSLPHSLKKDTASRQQKPVSKTVTGSSLLGVKRNTPNVSSKCVSEQKTASSKLGLYTTQTHQLPKPQVPHLVKSSSSLPQKNTAAVKYRSNTTTGYRFGYRPQSAPCGPVDKDRPVSRGSNKSVQSNRSKNGSSLSSLSSHEDVSHPPVNRHEPMHTSEDSLTGPSRAVAKSESLSEKSVGHNVGSLLSECDSGISSSRNVSSSASHHTISSTNSDTSVDKPRGRKAKNLEMIVNKQNGTFELRSSDSEESPTVCDLKGSFPDVSSTASLKQECAVKIPVETGIVKQRAQLYQAKSRFGFGGPSGQKKALPQQTQAAKAHSASLERISKVKSVSKQGQKSSPLVMGGKTGQKADIRSSPRVSSTPKLNKSLVNKIATESNGEKKDVQVDNVRAVTAVLHDNNNDAVPSSDIQESGHNRNLSPSSPVKHDGSPVRLLSSPSKSRGGSIEKSGHSTPTPNSLSSENDQRDFLIDDEISDQPGLLFDDVSHSQQETAPSKDESNAAEQEEKVQEKKRQTERSLSPLHLPQHDTLARIRSESMTESCGTLSPCESIASDDLIMDFEDRQNRFSFSPPMSPSSCGQLNILLENEKNSVFGHKLDNIIEAEPNRESSSSAQPLTRPHALDLFNGPKFTEELPSPLTDEVLQERDGLLAAQDGIVPPRHQKLLRARTLGSPDVPTSLRPPRQATGIDGDFVLLDRSTYNALCQDFTEFKTDLLKLKRCLQEVDTLNPFESNVKNGLYLNFASSDLPLRVDGTLETEETISDDVTSNSDKISLLQKVVDLQRQLVFQQEQLKEKEQVVKLLQQQMTKYTIESSSPERCMCNSATQTERPRTLSSGPGMSRTSSVDDGLGPTVSSSDMESRRLLSSEHLRRSSPALYQGDLCVSEGRTGHTAL